MLCPSCGVAAASPTQKFCAECGTRLQQTCPSCSTPYEGSPKFCPECGFALQGGIAPAQAAVAVAPTIQPAVAVAPAIEAAASTVAERKLVSILFADLVGFTAMSESRDAEAVREQLTEYFGVAQEIITRYGGTVEKFIGDAVMAVWGTPVSYEDDAERAVRAALELVDAVGRLGRDGAKLSARAGVLTGEAAVTLGASNQGMVAGDLVNTASRLQSIAPPGTVIVGEATRQSAERAIVFEPAGEQELKGKVSPVPAYRAVRVVAQRGGVGRADQLEAPFMGRDTEMRLVKDLFHAAPREKRPRLLSIIGQAGIGKSRLAWEFLKYIDGIFMTVRWHQGRSPAYGEGISFWALAEMVRSRVGLLELDDAATTRAKLAKALEEYVPDEVERRWIGPRLEQLLGMAEADSGGRDDLFAAWRTFFERVAGDDPAVLVFEDLHWADPGQLDFIDHMLEWSRGHAIYIITLARPELLERRPNWGAGQRSFTSLDLEPLPDQVIREILASLVPGLPEPTMEQIVSRAEGIPLYAVETVRMLLQEGRLELHDGVYRPVGDLSTLAVPATLHALIALAAGCAGRHGSVPAPVRIGPGPDLHPEGPEGGDGPGRRPGGAAACPRAPGAADARQRSTLAGTGPVRLRPGARPRRRLRHPHQARPQGRAPCRRGALRVAPGRRDHRRHGGALPRRLPQRSGGSRCGGDPGPCRRPAAARGRASHRPRFARAGGPLPGAGAGDHAGRRAPVAAAAPDRRCGRPCRAL